MIVVVVATSASGRPSQSGHLIGRGSTTFTASTTVVAGASTGTIASYTSAATTNTMITTNTAASATAIDAVVDDAAGAARSNIVATVAGSIGVDGV